MKGIPKYIWMKKFINKRKTKQVFLNLSLFFSLIIIIFFNHSLAIWVNFVFWLQQIKTIQEEKRYNILFNVFKKKIVLKFYLIFLFSFHSFFFIEKTLIFIIIFPFKLNHWFDWIGKQNNRSLTNGGLLCFLIWIIFFHSNQQ